LYVVDQGLVEFYQRMQQASFDAGYKLIVTALVREADVPTFFDDVSRYWNSIDDATGRDVLFVFAGSNVHEKLHGKTYLRSRRQAVAYESSDISMSGGLAIYCNDYVAPTNSKPPSRHNLAEDHTRQVSQLRDFLGLREADLPCYHFTLGGPSLRSHLDRETFILPFAEVGELTAYMMMKVLVEKCEEHFRSVDRFVQRVGKLQENEKRSERRARIKQGRRPSKLHAIDKYRSDKHPEIGELISILSNPVKVPGDKARCVALLKTLKLTLDKIGMAKFQSAIDVAFLDDRAAEANAGENKWAKEGREIEEALKDQWRAISNELKSMKTLWEQSGRVQSAHEWDYFISYPSKDIQVAVAVYIELTKKAKAFLDQRCLRPGDRWTERLAAAQQTSRATVLIVTGNSAQAWYQESEAARAINLTRHGRHRIIPLLFGDEVMVPFGLEQIHAIRLQKLWDIQGIVRKLEALN
jgi:hypothetical protein